MTTYVLFLIGFQFCAECFANIPVRLITVHPYCGIIAIKCYCLIGIFHNLEKGGLGVDGRTILEWTLKKWVSIRGIGLIRLGIGNVGQPL